MNIVIAIDSFKGSLTSLKAGHTIEKGIKRVYKDAAVFTRPIADGGEGTVEALALGMGGDLVHAEVTGPLNEKITAVYGIIDDTHTAIIEMSAAAGITLVPDKLRNPLNTTTYGVGELIKDAIARGCRNFIVGIGGSATNDGGTGMLCALGYRFLDDTGKPVANCGAGLQNIVAIDTSNALPELSECHFRVACDVTNPLCGNNGCSAIFGPQKGATPRTVAVMDEWLANYAALTKTVRPSSDSEYPGTGAAGGLGFAFLSYLNATLESGIKIVLEETKLEDYIKNADIVVTGEGRIDAQTVMGKVPAGVAALAGKYKKPVIAFSGCVADDAGICNEKGIDAFFPILRNVVSLSEAMDTENACRNLENTAEQVFRLIKTFEKDNQY